jgi:hypothetical protein
MTEGVKEMIKACFLRYEYPWKYAFSFFKGVSVKHKSFVVFAVVCLFLLVSVPGFAMSPFTLTADGSNFVAVGACGFLDKNTGITWNKNIPVATTAEAAAVGYVDSVVGTECGSGWRFATIGEIFTLRSPAVGYVGILEKLIGVGFDVGGVWPPTEAPSIMAGGVMEYEEESYLSSLFDSEEFAFATDVNIQSAYLGSALYWPIVQDGLTNVPAVELVSANLYEYAPASGNKYLKGLIKIRAVDYCVGVNIKIFKEDIGGGNRSLLKAYRLMYLRPGVVQNLGVYIPGGTTTFKGFQYDVEVQPLQDKYLQENASGDPIVLNP